MHCSDGGGRAAQRQPLDEQPQLRQPPATLVATGLAGKPGQAVGAVARQPPLCGPQRHARRRVTRTSGTPSSRWGLRSVKRANAAVRCASGSPTSDAARPATPGGAAAAAPARWNSYIGWEPGSSGISTRRPDGHDEGWWIVAPAGLDALIPTEPVIPAILWEGYRSST
jgi:hypothetical protein